MPQPIILKSDKRQSRILRPFEFESIRTLAKPYQQLWLDALLTTGMRYEELALFQKNPQWFDKTFIHLPVEANRKHKALKQRSVRLSRWGQTIIPLFLTNSRPIPNRAGIRADLLGWAKSAGIGIEGISAKMFRKTWESWITIKYPTINPKIILLSQGHNDFVSLNYYLSVPFTEEDKALMGKYTDGYLEGI